MSGGMSEMRTQTKTRRPVRSVAVFGGITLALLVFGAFRADAPAQDVVITSEQKGAETLVLGLTAFTCTAGNPKTLTQRPDDVLAADLDFSGRFRVQRSALFTPVAKALFAQEGALAYIRGTYTLEANTHTLQAELVDLESGEIILKRRYAGQRDELRASVHKFADELSAQLFGEKGVAQTRIAYVRRHAGAKEIWIMDYDGAGPRAVTRNGSINLNPLFMGGKDKLLFTSYTLGMPQFYKVDPERPSLQPAFTSRGMNTAPAYNIMDDEVVFASTMDGNSEIYRRKVAGTGKAERLTFSSTIETSPSWSPNGQEIVFISDRSGKPMLYIMDRDGSNTRRITYDFAYCGSPTWSPRGDRIAFTVMEGGNTMNIYTIAPDGSEAVRLTSGGSNESPAWSPDGRFLAFSSTRSGSADIYVMQADGDNVRRLSWSGGNTMPAWSGY
jgi:TolB protein